MKTGVSTNRQFTAGFRPRNGRGNELYLSLRQSPGKGQEAWRSSGLDLKTLPVGFLYLYEPLIN